MPSIIRGTQFPGRNSVSQLPSRPSLAIKMPLDVYKASRLIKRHVKAPKVRERASCDNMFLTRFCPPPVGRLARGFVLARVITFPMMLSVLLLPKRMRKAGCGVYERGRGRYEERRAESAMIGGAADKDEGERKREWNTTSTIATRKFDFQIGVARANGPRGEGRSSYVGSLCITSVSVYQREGMCAEAREERG